MASDISQESKPRLRNRASFSRNPVADTLEFDKDLPPDSIEETLEERDRRGPFARPKSTMPSQQISQLSSLRSAGRGAISAPPQPRRAMTTFSQALAPSRPSVQQPPPRALSMVMPPSGRTPPSLAYQNFRSPSNGHSDSSDEGDSDSDDEDAFTAVGTGVATDLELLDDDMPANDFPTQTRPTSMLIPARTVNDRAGQLATLQTNLNLVRQSQSQLALPSASRRPSSPGMTANAIEPPRPVAAYKPPSGMNAPPEDTPEEKALIKLLAVGVLCRVDTRSALTRPSRK